MSLFILKKMFSIRWSNIRSIISKFNSTIAFFYLTSTLPQFDFSLTFMKLISIRVHNYRLKSYWITMTSSGYCIVVLFEGLFKNQLTSQASVQFTLLSNEYVYLQRFNWNYLILITWNNILSMIFERVNGNRASSIHHQFNNKNWSIYRCTNINLVFEVLILLKWHIPNNLSQYYVHLMELKFISTYFLTWSYMWINVDSRNDIID